MKQTPINDIFNADVLNLMNQKFSGVVEVGSSSGALAKAYREINPNCSYVGIEIDAEYAERSKQCCTEVILGNAEHLSDDTLTRLGNAQCWIFADALEHLYDPWKMLRRIREHSRDGVEVIACVPNMQYWGLQTVINGGSFRYQDSGLLDRTHIRWFTRISLIDMFQSAGFSVEKITARIFQKPSPEVISAIRAMAQAVGNNSEMAESDAMPFQYVIRAVALPNVDTNLAN